MLDRQLEDFKVAMPRQDINIDAEVQMAMKYRVRGIPTMILVDESGTELKRVTGSQTEAQLTKFFLEEV
jgi:thioredoxin-like negative regulator of GroEL